MIAILREPDTLSYKSCHYNMYKEQRYIIYIYVYVCVYVCVCENIMESSNETKKHSNHIYENIRKSNAVLLKRFLIKAFIEYYFSI